MGRTAAIIAGLGAEGTFGAIARQYGASAPSTLIRRVGSALDSFDVRFVHNRGLGSSTRALAGEPMTNSIWARAGENMLADPRPGAWAVHDITDQIFASVELVPRGADELVRAGRLRGWEPFGYVSFVFDPARTTAHGVLALDAVDALGWALPHRGSKAVAMAMAEQLAMRAGFRSRLEGIRLGPYDEVGTPRTDIDDISLLVDDAAPEALAVDTTRQLLQTRPFQGIPAEAHLNVRARDAIELRVAGDFDLTARVSIERHLGRSIPDSATARAAVLQSIEGAARANGIPLIR